MKKIILIVISLITIALIAVGVFFILNNNNSGNVENTTKDDTPKEYVSIMSYEYYTHVDINNVKELETLRYTEAGLDYKKTSDRSEIESIYNMLSQLKVGERTERACEDNTTIYQFHMNDDMYYSVEIECDWFVIAGFRYNIVK